MTGFGKFLVGTAATSLLAWGAHSQAGADYIDGIEGNAKAAFDTLELGEGAGVAMARDPLARIAVVSGEHDEIAKKAIREKLLAVPGVSAVRFASGDAETADDGAADANAGPVAREEEVASCQTDVDAVMDGQTINFQSGSAYLAPASLRIIDSLAETLGRCAGMTVAVAGHTDATGSAEINQTLSTARAESVAAALAERGIDAGRITSAGFGSSQPKVDGTGAEANAANRRIEFTLTAGAGDSTAAPEGE